MPLLAPQSSALRISAYRDFHPIPSTYSFWAFKPFYGNLKQPKQTKAYQCRPRQTKAGINFASIEASKCTSIPSIQVSKYQSIQVSQVGQVQTRVPLLRFYSVLLRFQTISVRVNFHFFVWLLYQLVTGWCEDDLVCLTCVTSSWAMVTLLKSSLSLSFLKVLITSSRPRGVW